MVGFIWSDKNLIGFDRIVKRTDLRCNCELVKMISRQYQKEVEMMNGERKEKSRINGKRTGNMEQNSADDKM